MGKPTHTPHNAKTRAIMSSVCTDTQVMLNAMVAASDPEPYGPSAVMEGALFAFCAVLFQLRRPDDLTPAELADMIGNQAAKYMAAFEAEETIGPAQGNA